MDILEKMFLDILDKIGPANIKMAIDNRTSILKVILPIAPTSLIETAKFFYKIYGQYENQVTSDNLLAYIKEKRPDIYDVVTAHPDGKAWIDANIREILSFLKNGK